MQALQQKIPCPRPISQCQKKEREGGRRKVITENNNLSTYMYVLIGIVWHLSKLSSECPDFYLIGKSSFSTHSSLCKFNYLKAQHLCKLSWPMIMCALMGSEKGDEFFKLFIWLS